MCSFQGMHVSTHKGVPERDCIACLEPKLVNHSLQAALTQAKKFSDSRKVIWCPDCLYTTYIFFKVVTI